MITTHAKSLTDIHSVPDCASGFLALALGVLLLVTACGGNPPSTPTTPSPAPMPAPAPAPPPPPPQVAQIAGRWEGVLRYLWTAPPGVQIPATGSYNRSVRADLQQADRIVVGT